MRPKVEYYQALVHVILICLYQGKSVLSLDTHGGGNGTMSQNATIIDIQVVYNSTNSSTLSSKQDYSLIIKFEYANEDYILDLIHNRYLEPESAVLRYKQNGQYVTEKSKPSERCLFTGSVRGATGSTVALSTCQGVISGMVSEPGRTLLLSPADGGRYLLQTVAATPGHSGHRRPPSIARRRRRREAIPLRRPVGAGPDSLYLELALVVDHDVYRRFGRDINTVHRRVKQIANIVHSIYARLDIFVALVGVDVWTEGDEITLSANADDTLTNFLFYRRERMATEMPNDNAQLITGTKFEGGIVGKALRRVMCTYQYSGGVSTDHTEQVALLAATVAHEMGHNFGIEHDTAACECPDARCVMSASSSSIVPTQWSSCSKEQLKNGLTHGLGHCLHDRPSAPLFSSPVCGNGFVEPEEECDCGLPSECTTPCCDPRTCRLRGGNGTCASGACCDLQTCRLRSAGDTCRPAKGECDLSEFCNGKSELCPDDVHRLNGHSCLDGESHCYAGQCTTRDEQCRLLWGKSGSNSAQQCYEQNTAGTQLGDCGYSWRGKTYTPCQESDIQCGRLHCVHLNERLEYGIEGAALLSVSFGKLDGKVLPCRSAIVDLGLRQRDPGLVPQGAVCGPDKMCVDQRCVSVASVTAGYCPSGCAGRGVCNSRGNCHCQPGWAPPNCTERGAGGSVDSGPDMHSGDGGHTAAVVLLVLFLGVVPLIALVLCALYMRRNGLSPGQFVSGCPDCGLSRCGLPRCAGRRPNCCRLCPPPMPGLAALRRKLPTGGGGGGGSGGTARSVRRPDPPREAPGKTASCNVRLLMLSGEDELLQPASGGGTSPRPPRPPPPAVPSAAPPTRGLASSLLGRLGALARPASTSDTGRASDKLVCEVKPTTKSPTGTPVASPARKSTVETGAGGSGVKQVVADKLRSPTEPRTTFGMLNRQSAAPAATVKGGSAADASKRTTFDMSTLGRREREAGASTAGAAGPSATAAGPSATARPVSTAASARSAFLSRETSEQPRVSGPLPIGAVTGQVKAAAESLQRKPATSTARPTSAAPTVAPTVAPVTVPVTAATAAAVETQDRKYANVPNSSSAANSAAVDGAGDRRYANIPDTAPSPTLSAAAVAKEEREAGTWSRGSAMRSLLGGARNRNSQADRPTAAAERIPLVQRSDSVPAAGGSRSPVPQVRFAPDPQPQQQRPALTPVDSAPAGPRPVPLSGPGSRSSTLESDRGSTLERDSSGGGGGSKASSTLSRVASVFKRGDKPSDPPPAAAEPTLRPSQSFKAAKIDRDTVRTLGISNPIPQPSATATVGQFSTLPTSPGGKRGGRGPARAASDASRPQRPVSLLVRPSEPPPRPPAPTDLYDDCNADWSAVGRRGGTPEENIYCTIDEAPDERPRPKSMVEPAVHEDIDTGRLYQNTIGRTGAAPWRTVTARQPTIGRTQSAATRAWSPIVEEKPLHESATAPAAVATVADQPAKTTAATVAKTGGSSSGLASSQPRPSVPWAAKFSSSPAPTKELFPRPLSMSGAGQKPTATVAPASQLSSVPAAVSETAKQVPEYARPTPKSAARSATASGVATSSATTSAVAATTASTSATPAASSSNDGGSGAEGSSKQSQPSSESTKQTGSASKASESPGSTRSAKSTTSTKSSVSSAPTGKKSSSTASGKQSGSSAQPSKSTSKQPSSAAQSSKKVTTPSSSSRPGTLSAASSQQSMSSVTSSRSGVSSPSSERTDSATGRTAGKKAGTATGARKTGTGKPTSTSTGAAGGAKAAGAAGGKAASTAAGKSGATAADKASTKAGPSTTSATASGKTDATAAKKEPATRVGPAPTKASQARAAAAAAKVSAAAAKTGPPGRAGGPKSTAKS